ncbi:MAG: hypothetical protein M3O70_14895 [Actinomycetota bacterium]|nr:hypothetical protein [Actinomycetota bacterium]
MKRREHPTDEYVRGLPLLSDEQARLLSDSDAKQALFQEILTMPADNRARPAPSPARPQRRSVVLAAMIATLTFAAVGAAAYFNSVETTTAVACHMADGSVSVIDAVSGDPLADCAAHWQQATGAQPPALVAYDNGRGGIEVVPEAAQVPDGWRALEPGVAQDPRLIELEAALGDHIDGLRADCYRVESARAITERELDRLGLDTWQAVAERGSADGERTCTYFLLDPDRQRVVLIPLEGMIAPSGSPHSLLASRLDQELDRCLTTEEAADLTREIAADVGVAPEGLIIQHVTDENAQCARADVNVGGRVEVTIRGPLSP